jgi:anti-anti-sigma factor
MMEARASQTAGLSAAVETATGGSRIVLHGRLDRTGEEALARAYLEATAADDGEVELDFEGVDYINSTGIALVVRLLADARRDGRAVRARGLTEHYREIFRITRLSDLMTIVEDQGGQS